MTTLHDARLAKQRARWLRQNEHLYMRPDAHRFVRPDTQRWLRPDWKRFVQPAFVPFYRALLEGKANFNPSQPRVPAGNPDGGQWTEGDWDSELAEGDDGAPTDISDAGRRPPGIGHNEGPPLNELPEIPPRRPPTAQETNTFFKAAAQWLARAIRAGTPVGAFLTAMEAASWLDTDRAFIDAYQDPPKTLEELQQHAREPKWGYHIHHVVETPARMWGMSETLISGPENLVRIPALKHWQVTGWFARPNDAYGGMSPREYLKDKDWDERMRVGRDALVEHGVLKP